MAAPLTGQGEGLEDKETAGRLLLLQPSG